MNFKNPYAITNNEKLIHITVYKKEMGKVICPVCKDELIFCEGSEISNYFRHKAGNVQHSERDYVSAIESIRHLEMKEKLITEKKIPLRSCRWCKKYEEENLKEYTEWRKEVRWFDYVIDVVANVKGFSVLSYLIEVVNTHKCSDKKYRTLEETGVSWMEIDCDGKYLRGNYECEECKTKINFGKYKGLSIGKILTIDKEYCLWMWKNAERVDQNVLNVLEKYFSGIERNVIKLKNQTVQEKPIGKLYQLLKSLKMDNNNYCKIFVSKCEGCRIKHMQLYHNFACSQLSELRETCEKCLRRYRDLPRHDCCKKKDSAIPGKR